jgi:transposase
MVVVDDHQQREPSMGEITTVGLDLAKNVFQVHAVDEAGAVVERKRLRRGQVLGFFEKLPSCLVGLEACATAHHWARKLIALGHEVRLMPPHYVKAYVKRNKNDTADAEAICEAVKRPSMRFVPVKTSEQQSALMMHRIRDLLIRQRTMLVNALRGHLAEFGLVEAQGLHKIAGLIAIVRDDTDGRVPDIARQMLKLIAEQIDELRMRIAAVEAQVLVWHKNNAVCQRLATIPGIGPIIATAIAATVPDPIVFRSGREFAAWLGLVPRQHSTGGKSRLSGISKRGDGYLRRLLVNGAISVLLWSKMAKTDPWLISLRGRRPLLVVAVALANKMARMAWALMSRQDTYRHAATVA